MGCSATKIKTKNITYPHDQHSLMLCYRANSTYIDSQGQQYYVLREGSRFLKVPSLKQLDLNPLYKKRSRKASDETNITKNN